jgi:hypothetical protein
VDGKLGVEVGIGIVDDETRTDEKLDIGTVVEEATGGTTPLHVPNADLHPVPQY